jgi:hypothetical protein
MDLSPRRVADSGKTARLPKSCTSRTIAGAAHTAALARRTTTRPGRETDLPDGFFAFVRLLQRSRG